MLGKKAKKSAAPVFSYEYAKKSFAQRVIISLILPKHDGKDAC